VWNQEETKDTAKQGKAKQGKAQEEEKEAVTLVATFTSHRESRVSGIIRAHLEPLHPSFHLVQIPTR
jgi:hypothetical protein